MVNSYAVHGRKAYEINDAHDERGWIPPLP